MSFFYINLFIYKSSAILANLWAVSFASFLTWVTLHLFNRSIGHICSNYYPPFLMLALSREYNFQDFKFYLLHSQFSNEYSSPQSISVTLATIWLGWLKLWEELETFGTTSISKRVVTLEQRNQKWGGVRSFQVTRRQLA